MKVTLRGVLLLGAVVLFVLALVSSSQGSDLLAIGLALFAGAFLVDDLGIGKRRLGR